MKIKIRYSLELFKITTRSMDIQSMELTMEYSILKSISSVISTQSQEKGFHTSTLKKNTITIVERK